jgi:caa(3)-type oxidase subunit IV
MSHQTAEKRVNYLGVFILLAALTLIETAASYLQQESVKFPVLIVISVVKAVIVLLYFMHLKFDSRIFSYLFIAGCLLSVPLILVMIIVMPVIANY